MEEQAKLIKMAIAAICASLTAIFGWFIWPILILIVAMSFDYLTGWLAARHLGEWKSSIAKSGILKKVGILIIVGVSGCVDLLIGLMLSKIPALANSLPFTYTVLICPVVVIWYSLAEIGSIIENVERMGAYVPGFLLKIITVLRATIEKTGNAITDKADDDGIEEKSGGAGS